MRDTIVLTRGTGPAAVGLDFRRRLSSEIDSIERRASYGANGAAAHLVELARDLREGIHVRAFDIDGTNVYDLNEPLRPVARTWPIGNFIRCSLPGREMVAHIKEGRHGDRFELLNPDALLSIDADVNASGGTRVNGWTSMMTERDRVVAEIRGLLSRILQRRRELARPVDTPVRIFEIGSGFGGFAGGSDSPFRDFVYGIARSMHLNVEWLSILLLPGTTQPKDPENSDAIAYALLDEASARSTRMHWHRERRPGSHRNEMVRSIFVPPMLLTDTNNAPGEPSALSQRNFASMVAELLRTWILTDMGDRIAAAAPDFNSRAEELTAAGEPRFGRSIGISVIHLDRDQIEQAAVSRLEHHVLDLLLTTVDQERLRTDVRAFLEARRFVEGGHVRQLSDRLLEPGEGRHGQVGVDRFRQTFRFNTSGLQGLSLLEAAEDRLQLSMAQTGDFDTALRERAQAAFEAITADVTAHTDELARTPAIGLLAARQWQELLISIVANLAAESAKDSADLEAEIERHQAQVEYFRDTYRPAVSGKNFIYRWLRRRSIVAKAAQYVRHLEALSVARLQYAAHNTATELLKSLDEPLNQYLGRIQATVDTLTTARDEAATELARIRDHSSDFACPVGLPLVRDAADLDEYYIRLLPDGSEARATTDIHARLVQAPQGLRIGSDTVQLLSTLRAVVETTFRDAVSRLHVVDELRRRLPTREQLGAALRERSRESRERLQLKDSTDSENGLHMVRLVGMDANRAGNLADIIQEYDYTLGMPFQTVNIDDPERIVFFQFRAVFPISDWARFDVAREIYRRSWSVIPFEKYRVIPGERGDPSPGELLDESAARVLLVKSWLVDRLDYDPDGDMWQLRSADNGASPLPIQSDLRELLSIEGYRRGVDINSHYCCHYLAYGPQAIRDRLEHLAQARAERVRTSSQVERRLVPLFSEEVQGQIEQELAWWTKNSVPGAMAWANLAQSNGKGGRRRNGR
jgi:hypothetical protein